MALFRHGIAVGLDLSSALVWPTDELFNINSNSNIIMEGEWTESGKSEAHLSRYVIAKVKFERLHYGYTVARLRGNATASLKSAYYVYDHQRNLLTTTRHQPSNSHSSSAVMLQRVLQRRSIALSMLYACYTFQSQRNVLIKQR